MDGKEKQAELDEELESQLAKLDSGLTKQEWFRLMMSGNFGDVADVFFDHYNKFPRNDV
jgi:hypothetical protein